MPGEQSYQFGITTNYGAIGLYRTNRARRSFDCKQIRKNAFDITENFITVTIPLERYTAIPSAKKEIALTGVQQKIIKLIKDNPQITISEMAEKISLGKTAVNMAIKKLKDKKVIYREGSNKSGYWVIL